MSPREWEVVANESEKNSQTWLADFGITERVSRKDMGKQMCSGLFRMNKGNALGMTTGRARHLPLLPCRCC